MPSFRLPSVSRYAIPSSPDLILLFDGNGFIAGVQTVALSGAVEGDAYFPYSSSPWYLEDSFFGDDAFLATSYFVDPAVTLASCDGGRTQEDFDAQGTGYGLFLKVLYRYR